MKKITPLTFLVSFFCFWSLVGGALYLVPKLNQVQAQSETQADYFDISLDAVYNVKINGQTLVEQTFTITNKSPKYFIKEYAIIVGSNQLEKIKATQNKQTIPTNVVTTGNQTSISLNFADELLGLSKRRQFTLSYTSPDTALVSGNVLEVAIPRLAEGSNFSKYSVQVKTPVIFGSPTRSNPQFGNWTVENSQIVTSFNNLNQDGILIFYGQEQYYDLDLRYHLKNPTGNRGITQIALPPDTQFQKINIINLDPMPLEIESDPDGNWIASYLIEPNQTQTINLAAKALLSLDPLDNVPHKEPGTYLLEPQEFWPVNNQEIKTLAQEHPTPKDIYDFVVNTLSYDYEKIGAANKRLGTIESLNNPTHAVCQEFTDLFVTLARSNSIPSRRLTGYAYTQNNILRPLSLVDDILHTWPEYYDRQTQIWKQVDPTWEDTTGGINFFDQFDLSHIVFSINGQDSSIPYPAGSYKLNGASTKDVEVKFADSFPREEFGVELNLIPQKLLGVELTGKYRLKINNLTGQAWYNLPLSIISQNNQVKLKTDQIYVLLPYQRLEIPVQIVNNQTLAPTQAQAEISLHEKKQSQNITAGSLITSYLSNSVLILGLGIGLVAITLTTGSILVYRRHRKTALRRQSKKSKKESRQLQETPKST